MERTQKSDRLTEFEIHNFYRTLGLATEQSDKELVPTGPKVQPSRPAVSTRLSNSSTPVAVATPRTGGTKLSNSSGSK